jgi:hypothetical protein
MEKESYTAEELAALFKEWRNDYAAAKREDAHWYGREAFQEILDGKTEPPAAEKTNGKGIGRSAMNEKQRLEGFKALVEDHKSSQSYFEQMDGSHREWHELSPQSKLQYIAGDAALYDLPFERFAEAVRDVLPVAAIAEASLQVVLHYQRELHGLWKLLPDDGRTEPVPLVDRFKEMLSSQQDQIVDGNTKAPAVERTKDKGIKR